MAEFTWQLDQSSSLAIVLNTKVLQFGDGYEQIANFGINHAKQNWQASITNTQQTVNAVHDFLVATKGESFVITPIPNKPSIKARLQGDVGITQIGGNVWRINFNFVQTF